MKIVNNSIYILLLFITVSCEDFLTVDVPDSQLSSELVFEDVRTAEAVLTNIYTKLHNSVMVTGDTGGITVLLGNYADELNCYGSGLLEFTFHQNQLLTTNESIKSLWRNSYNLIYEANNVIEGVENTTALVQADRDRLKGEALFVRAYIHFYLNQLFGEVPYITSTDYRVNTTISKQSNTTIFSLLEQDLNESEGL